MSQPSRKKKRDYVEIKKYIFTEEEVKKAEKRYLEKSLFGIDPSSVRGIILKFLSKKPARAKGVAKSLGEHFKSMNQVYNLLARLADKGLVTRKRENKHTRYELTDRGKKWVSMSRVILTIKGGNKK